MVRVFAVVLIALWASLLSSLAWASDKIERGPIPAWVKPVADAPASTTASDDAPVRFQLFDQQYRFDETGNHAFRRMRTQILSPAGLAPAGNVAIAWNPSDDTMTVHQLSILRNGQTIDILANQSFTILRREQNLETASLNGVLTATLQPADIRVGDTLELAYSTTSNNAVLGRHAEFIASGAMPVGIGRLHMSASWPSALPIRTRATEGWTLSAPRRKDGYTEVSIDLANTDVLTVPTDAPPRFNSLRQFELTDYRGWEDISRIMAPLYVKAATLEAGSPLTAEIERIRQSSSDPLVQAAAALRLVQDEVRYVALNMGEAGLMPTSADETWRQRFGDCKGKTALLLALLQGLGIEARAAVVSVALGDGLDQRLPLVSLLDHVLVRVDIGGQVYWLDGARIGDRELKDLKVPPYRWALPVTESGSGLERLTPSPLSVSPSETLFGYDASAGLFAPAKFSGDMILRDEMATYFNTALASITAAQKDEYLRNLWKAQIAGLEIQTVGSVYDAATNTLRLPATGHVVLDWSGPTGLAVPGSRFVYGADEERPDGPYKTLPFVVDHPAYVMQRVTLKLPLAGEGFTLGDGQVDQTEAGNHFLRKAQLNGDTLTIEASIRSLVSEVSSADMDAARPRIEALTKDRVRLKPPAHYRVSAGDRSAWAADTPTTAKAYIDRGLALDSTGARAEAIEAYDQAIKLEPDNANAYANRGIVHFWLGDYDEAEADFDKASDLDPAERIAMNGHALIAAKDKRYTDVVIEMSRALRQAPTDSFALNYRAWAYEQMKDVTKALRDLDTLIAAQPNSPGPKLARIAMLNRVDRADDANREMDALAAVYPDNTTVLYNQVTMKIERKDDDAAVAILDHAIPLLGDKAEPAELMRAEIWARRQDIPRFTAELDAIRARPDPTPQTLNGLCWTQAMFAITLDQALKDCDAALDMAPNDPGIMDSRALVLLQSGDTTGALAVYDAVLTDSPELSSSLYGRSLAKTVLGQDGSADREAALKGNPDVGVSYKTYEERHPTAVAATPTPPTENSSSAPSPSTAPN